MKVLAVIPCRYASTRLRGKVLRDLGGKSVVERVYDSAKQSDATMVCIATEDDIITNEVHQFGGTVFMTKECDSGTERVIEIMKEYEYDAFINIQADEPFITAEEINKIIRLLEKEPNKVATLVGNLEEYERFDRNTVKAVAWEDGELNLHLQMFTRSPVLFNTGNIYKHIGIYGFSRSLLETISNLEVKTINETEDNLEQLRWADEGIKFSIDFTPNNLIGIDTEEDLKRAIKRYAES